MKKADLPFLGVLNMLLGFLVVAAVWMVEALQIKIAVLVVGILIIYVGARILFGFRNWKEDEQGISR
jgi:hypothetical protein